MLYAPRRHQAEIHKRLKRFNVLVCHRRFGKTVLAVNQLIGSGLRCKKLNPRFAYVAPLLKQAKAVAWDFLLHYGAPFRIAANTSELRIDLVNGARITLYGADNPDALRGIYLDGVVLDEYADMQPRTWTEVVRPALADRRGWAIFIGTPKGQNGFYDLYESAKADGNWYVGMFKASVARLHNSRKYSEAAQAFALWNKTKGIVLAGLVARRASEAELYLSDTPTQDAAPEVNAQALG